MSLTPLLHGDDVGVISGLFIIFALKIPSIHNLRKTIFVCLFSVHIITSLHVLSK